SLWARLADVCYAPHDRPIIQFFFLSLLPPPPHYTLFPYTTLFRSPRRHGRPRSRRREVPRRAARRRVHADRLRVHRRRREADLRSEEHTSELQSLAYLVCRLLLEKKKK